MGLNIYPYYQKVIWVWGKTFNFFWQFSWAYAHINGIKPKIALMRHKKLLVLLDLRLNSLSLGKRGLSRISSDGKAAEL